MMNESSHADQGKAAKGRGNASADGILGKITVAMR